ALVALASRGARVLGIARSERLARVAREAPGAGSAIIAGRAGNGVGARAPPGDPDLVVMSLGVTPRMGPIDELTWESISAPWNVDLYASWLFAREAVRRQLRPGSTFVLLS